MEDTVHFFKTRLTVMKLVKNWVLCVIHMRKEKRDIFLYSAAEVYLIYGDFQNLFPGKRTCGDVLISYK